MLSPLESGWIEKLESIHWLDNGLTRGEIRQRWGSMPDELYLHLPDSKRFSTAHDVVFEAANAKIRVSGEFGERDSGPTTAQHDFGPAGYGESPLNTSAPVLEGGNFPLAGFDGNSLETESEFPV